MARLMNSNNNKGFTLIELLVVIAIIGILGAIAIPLFLGQRTKAMMSEAKTNIRIIATANENFYAENGRYAPWPEDRQTTPLGVDTFDYVGDKSVGSLDGELRALNFGTLVDLNFTYSLQSCADGQAFLAKSVGKAGSPVAGSTFTLNQKNELSDATLTCGL